MLRLPDLLPGGDTPAFRSAATKTVKAEDLTSVILGGIKTYLESDQSDESIARILEARAPLLEDLLAESSEFTGYRCSMLPPYLGGDPGRTEIRLRCQYFALYGEYMIADQDELEWMAKCDYCEVSAEGFFLTEEGAPMDLCKDPKDSLGQPIFRVEYAKLTRID